MLANNFAVFYSNDVFSMPVFVVVVWLVTEFPVADNHSHFCRVGGSSILESVSKFARINCENSK